MLRRLSLFAAVSAIAVAAPAVAKNDKANAGIGNGAAVSSANGNGNGNGSGNGNTPTPSPSPAPAPSPVGCDYAAGVVFQSASYTGCSGFFGGNVISGGNNAADQAALGDALGDLGLTYSGSWIAKVEADSSPLVNGMIDFGQTLYGETIIGVHFGNIYNPQQLLLHTGPGNNENVTGFFRFDFGTSGARGVQLLNTRGYSNAALFSTGVGVVPEPSAWVVLIMGFGAVGAALRGRRRTRLAFG